MPRHARAKTAPATPATDLLSVWIGLLFWAGVFWLGGMFALTLDDRLRLARELPLWLQVLGLLLAVLGVVLILLSVHVLTGHSARRHLGGLPQVLVTTGVYGLMRHPMYLGFVTLAFGYGLLLSSFSFTVLFAPILAGSLGLKARSEDTLLARHHGRLHQVYRRHVPGFVPWVGGRP